jgi:hypothetical protein
LIGKIEKQSEGAYAINAFFCTALGLGFIGFFLWIILQHGFDSTLLFPCVFGGIFVVVGLAYGWKAYKGRTAQR